MDGKMDSIKASEIYSGDENPITMETGYQGDFFCEFAKIAIYPFDTQHCSIELHISGTSNNMTRLVAMPTAPPLWASITWQAGRFHLLELPQGRMGCGWRSLRGEILLASS